MHFLILINRLVLYGSVKGIGMSSSRSKLNESYNSYMNNSSGCARKRSPQDSGGTSWWNSQSSSSRFSSPSNQTDLRRYCHGRGKINPHDGRGKCNPGLLKSISLLPSAERSSRVLGNCNCNLIYLNNLQIVVMI